MGDLIADGGNKVFLSTSSGSLFELFPTSYNVKDSSKLLGSPAESGEIKYDHKVIQPRVVTFTGILKAPYFSEIRSLRNSVASQDLSKCICTFVGKGGTVKNMIIESMEEVGDKNRFDAVELKFTLKEYLVHKN